MILGEKTEDLDFSHLKKLALKTDKFKDNFLCLESAFLVAFEQKI